MEQREADDRVFETNAPREDRPARGDRQDSSLPGVRGLQLHDGIHSDYRRWLNILGSALRGLRKDPSAGSGLPLLLRLIVGTIPVAILGLLLNKFFERNFGKPLYAAVFLTANGLILFGVERLTDRRHAHAMAKDSDTAIVERVSLGQALVVGVGQSTALFAGISRFGVSISFGMMRGLSRSVAADFAFLLAFPAILGASLFKLPKLMHHGAIAAGSNGALLAGTIAAFIADFPSPAPKKFMGTARGIAFPHRGIAPGQRLPPPSRIDPTM